MRRIGGSELKETEGGDIAKSWLRAHDTVVTNIIGWDKRHKKRGGMRAGKDKGISRWNERMREIMREWMGEKDEEKREVLMEERRKVRSERQRLVRHGRTMERVGNMRELERVA